MSLQEAEQPETSLDILRIMEMIPHRYPFLLIDSVKDITLEKSATGVKNVSMNEPHFQGHFPGHPIMPGVLIVEAMAQTAAVLTVASLGGAAEGKLVYFMSIDNCRFRKPVVPGDVLELRVSVQKFRGAVWRYEGLGYVGDQKVAEATFAAMIRDR